MADRLDLPESLRQPPSKEALCQATRGLVSSGRAVDERGTEVAAQSGQGLRMDANILFFLRVPKGDTKQAQALYYVVIGHSPSEFRYRKWNCDEKFHLPVQTGTPSRLAIIVFTSQHREFR